ncbi:MAG TPA: hypothetical protein VGF55_05395 [Gemmataceae bacterium]|jgi:hypothetical protein
MRTYPAGVYPPLLGLAVCAALTIGCGQQVGKSGEVNPSDVSLNTISRIYTRAQQQLGRPPRGADELRPYAKDEGDLDKLLVSPNDNQPYVVVWGANMLTPADYYMVVVYERTGANGFRHVLTPTGTLMLSDADFAKATFPLGHKPAGL